MENPDYQFRQKNGDEKCEQNEESTIEETFHPESFLTMPTVAFPYFHYTQKGNYVNRQLQAARRGSVPGPVAAGEHPDEAGEPGGGEKPGRCDEDEGGKSAAGCEAEQRIDAGADEIPV